MSSPTSMLPRKARGRSAAIGFAMGAALLLAACDNGPKTAATVVLNVPSSTLVVGQHVQITPTVKDNDGNVLMDRQVVYTSSQPLVAPVTTEGEVVALSPGSTAITATVDAATASIGIVVSPVPVSRVTVAPDTATVRASETRQFTATPLDSAGNTLFDRPVTWSVSNASVASISATGLLSTLVPGTVVVTASIEGKTGQAQVTVSNPVVATIDVSPSSATMPENGSFRYSAIARDLNGRPISGASLSWSSSNTAVATVDATGLVSGVAPGVANILVNSGSAFGGAVAYVLPLVIGSVQITPDSARIDVGGTFQLSATVKDSAGGTVNNRPVFWASLDPAVASVSNSGLVTAAAPGDARIAATLNTVADTAIVHVNPLPVGSITIYPNPGTLGVGRSGSFTAVVRDTAGNVSPVPVQWWLYDTSIATTTEDGILTGVSAGTVLVYAAAASKVVTVNLTVDPTAVASILLAPASQTMSPGSDLQLSATPLSGGGAALAGRLITYSSSDKTIATVGPTGIVHAIKPGNTFITVSAEGVANVAAITVQ